MAKTERPYTKSDEEIPQPISEPITTYVGGRISFDSTISEEKECLEEAYYHTHRRPCAYTLEELREQINRSMDDIVAGRVYTQEQMKQMHPRI